VVSTCSSNSRLISRNNSPVRITNKFCVQVERSIISVANPSNGSSSNNWGGSCISSFLGGKMVSTGSSNSWFINRNNSSIGIIKKLSVEVKRSVIAVANISNRSSSISSFLGCKMVSTCSSNSWFISRDNSSIRKTYKLGV